MTDSGAPPSATSLGGQRRVGERQTAPPRPDRSTRADRGQTVQDFAIGASLFLLTVAFVFAFVPTLFTPFDTEIAPGQESQADRVADAIVAESSIDGRSNWLTSSTAKSEIDRTAAEIQNDTSLPATSQVNVTVRPLNASSSAILRSGGDALAGGDTYNGRPAATVTRIVVIKGVPECNPNDPAGGPACRLVVRVW